MRSHRLFPLMLFPVLAACGGAPDEGDGEVLGAQPSAVQGGEIDTSRANNFAVGIASRYGAVCSGTLIAPNLVLTARHCVVPPARDPSVTCSDKFGKNVAPSTLFVTTDTKMRSASDFYGVKEIFTPAERGFCGNDIALLILDENIPSSEAVPATPVVQFSMADSDELSGAITAIGYGITAPNASDSGVRRIREDIEIVCVPGSTAHDCKKSGYGRMLDSDKEFITEGYVCSGDSGGGAFDQASFDAGTPYVLGALSRGPQTDSECLAAIYSRTDAHADLILEAGAKAAEEGGYAPPSWLELPEPEAEGADDPAGEPCEGDGCEDGAAPAAPAKIIKRTTVGCAASPSSSSQGLAALALAPLALLFARRRRLPGARA